jgi:hypothetical protein
MNTAAQDGSSHILQQKHGLRQITFITCNFIAFLPIINILYKVDYAYWGYHYKKTMQTRTTDHGALETSILPTIYPTNHGLPSKTRVQTLHSIHIDVVDGNIPIYFIIFAIFFNFHPFISTRYEAGNGCVCENTSRLSLAFTQ